MAKTMNIGTSSSAYNMYLYPPGDSAGLNLCCTGAVASTCNNILFKNTNSTTNQWALGTGGDTALIETIGTSTYNTQEYEFHLTSKLASLIRINSTLSSSTTGLSTSGTTGIYYKTTTAHTFYGCFTGSALKYCKMVYTGYRYSSSSYYSKLFLSGNSYAYIDFHTGGDQSLDYHSRLLDGGSGITASGTLSSWSDRRVKENIKEITDNTLCINLLKELQPKEYNYINTKNKPMKYGFIAQEIEEVLDKYGIGPKDNDRYPLILQPETDEEDDMYTLDYNSVTGLLWKIVQIQRNTLKQEKQELEELKAEYQSLNS